MGPSNIALVKFFKIDQDLREAKDRLDGASRGVRAHERRLNEVTEKARLAQTQLREKQAKAGELELDIKTRDAKIERFREQQQQAKNHKEYQIFLTEINTEKVDKAKAEEQALTVMEAVEKLQAELKDLNAQLEGEQKKFTETKEQLGSRLTELQSEIDRIKPLRDEAATAVTPKAMEMYERMADRFEGEALAALGMPDRRREEYICLGCNMSVVADVYNRLRTRDEPASCPNCRRLLYIPDDLPPDLAVSKPKERRELKQKRLGDISIPASRQMSAADVSRSISAGQKGEEGEE